MSEPVSQSKVPAARIDTVFVPVRDVTRSAAWYASLFDLELIYRSEDGSYVGFRFARSGPGTAALTLYQSSETEPHSHPAFNFYTPDIEASHRIMKEQQVTVSEIHNETGVRFFHYWDPDGQRGEVVWFPE
ncbi:VOC family protein [Paenibacillus sp. JX-17]|uniref:VOC family protein n=1 Tax=Paenibacillus lacisoli TaxID=3064525 RepID=A0ABT9CB21_9BACL|nr:VOC family protein [Paenibacillus sp. JX-17]MDO7906454.1 VOC family protein [Paenibacillus sp. JX-17]